ncbi:MAG TPA: hypothetical protein VGQ83_33150 [Polyangia bacterium]
MRTAVYLVVLGLLVAARPARADKNDLALWRLGKLTVNPDGTIPQPGVTLDAAANQQYRSLASELGVVMAPRLLMPSDTLGYSGFQFDFDMSFTTINNNQTDPAKTLSPWRNVLERTDGVVPSMMTTIGVFARKGIWLPLPSFEIGAGALHLLDSNMFALQAYAKLALQEGFHGWPLPSIAVRGAASRLMGSSQLDLTVASLDFSASKAFGIGGTLNIQPYAGYNILWIIERGQVLDANPGCDAYVTTQTPTTPCPNPNGGANITPGVTELNSNFVFYNQNTIVRHRVFVGLKLRFNVVALTADYAYITAGSSNDANVPLADGTRANVKDQAQGQHQVSISLALDF